MHQFYYMNKMYNVKKLYSQTFQNLNPVHEFYNTVHLYMTMCTYEKMDPRNIVYL